MSLTGINWIESNLHNNMIFPDIHFYKSYRQFFVGKRVVITLFFKRLFIQRIINDEVESAGVFCVLRFINNMIFSKMSQISDIFMCIEFSMSTIFTISQNPLYWKNTIFLFLSFLFLLKAVLEFKGASFWHTF